MNLVVSSVVNQHRLDVDPDSEWDPIFLMPTPFKAFLLFLEKYVCNQQTNWTTVKV